MAEADIKKSLVKLEGAIEDLEVVIKSENKKTTKVNQGQLKYARETLQLSYGELWTCYCVVKDILAKNDATKQVYNEQWFQG